jgi:hypothetical protein
MLNRVNRIQNILRNLFILITVTCNHIAAQGITLPDAPSQAPVGGLGWLAILGGAMAYKKLRNKK